MKKLYLLRHAKSAWDDTSLDDRERPLAPRGLKAAKAMRKHLGKIGVSPDLILCSPALRARQTCGEVYAAMNDAPVTYDERLYTFSHSPVFDVLTRLTDAVGTLLLIGHNPAFEELARALSDPGDSAPEAYAILREKYPTGALAEIDLRIDHWADLRPGCGTLRRLTRPRDLED